MSNAMTLFQENTGLAVSSKFGALAKTLIEENDLGQGIRGSYAIVSIKAGRFRLKYKGEETLLTTLDPRTGQQQPVGSIDVVIVKANPFLNKQWYKGKYTEGSKELPDCYSLDGKAPSTQSREPQFANCAMCPKNQFGSAISDDGKKSKACRDTKKLAIVPLADIMNTTMGGAMLFRVPPSALKDLSSLADKLKGRGYPYNSVAIRLSFDMTVSHPKPMFDAIRPLTDDEAERVLEMFNSDSVERVLADNEIVHEAVGEEAPGTVDSPFLQDRVQPVAPTRHERDGEPAQPKYNPEITLAEVQPVPQRPMAMLNSLETPAPAPAIKPTIRLQPEPVLTAEQAPQAPATAPNPFAQSVSAKAAAAPKAAPVAPAEPVDVAPASPQLQMDIGSILAGLDNLGK